MVSLSIRYFMFGYYVAILISAGLLGIVNYFFFVNVVVEDLLISSLLCIDTC